MAMKNKLVIAFIVVMSGFVVSRPLFAHHSSAAYDMEHPMLVRTGWKREMIKAGDQLLVNGAPAKNGSKVMRLVTLTLANGQKYDGQGFK